MPWGPSLSEMLLKTSGVTSLHDTPRCFCSATDLPCEEAAQEVRRHNERLDIGLLLHRFRHQADPLDEEQAGTLPLPAVAQQPHLLDPGVAMAGNDHGSSPPTTLHAGM